VPPKNALLRLLPYARPHARGLIVSLIFGLGMMGTGLLIPPIIGLVFDDLREGTSSRLLLLAGLVIAVGSLEALLGYFRRYTAARAAIAMEEDMRNDLYAHLQRLHVGFHDGWQSGQLLSRAMGDLSTIRRFTGFGFMFLIINALQFAVVSALLLRLDVLLAVLTAVSAFPIMAITHRFDRTYRVISRSVQDTQGDLTTIIEESATGIRIIKAFGRSRLMAQRFGEQAQIVHDASMQGVEVRSFFWMLLRMLPNLTLTFLVLIGGRAVIDGSMTGGELATFVTYFLMLRWPIRSIGWILANAEESRTAAERFFEVMDSAPEIVDRDGAVAPATVTGALTFEDVHFAYPGSDDEILRGVDLTIEPGETLAIVGMTGCGKTTLASLVSRLYDPTAGSISLDGTDLRDIPLADLRRIVGVAFEDPVLFSMSARENLLLGHPEATDDDVRRALETANATFAYDLPWGLDTRVGEQGYSLSGGQRQRLALARAVIARPQVLVLDDPLSAVDVHTESLIEEALARVLDGVTALLVVHRPSTLALADRVALLDGGVIVAHGAHADLMATNELYRAILSQQAEEVVA
jgi:ATP-binding cassette, subfamily B, bacterial